MDQRPTDTAAVVSVFEPVLGTRLEVRSVVGLGGSAATVEQRVLAEIDRLEAVFSIYDDASELCRWRRGDDRASSDELALVLEVAARWYARSDGAYNPMVGVITERWRAASASGTPPSARERSAAAASIASLPYSVVDGHAIRHGNCGGLDLNAGAKGYIVDRALAAGLAEGSAIGLTVNLGGDLAHHGADSLLVGIEDPNDPHDNVPPKVVVEIRGGGLATSGSARRGFHVGNTWWGHVLDPRTAMPVAHVASVSAIAPDAMTADFVATIIAVLGPRDGLAFADSIDDVGACVIDMDGTLFRNDRWHGYERET
jgi:thiamine biosynthesis lipoprotein